MILGEVRRESADGLHRLVADVSWEDAPTARRERLFIEAAACGDGGLAATPAAFLPVVAAAAQAHGERRLRVEGAVDPVLLDGLADACAAFRWWAGGREHAVQIEAEAEEVRPCAPASTALLLSGGIDSLTSLIDNHRRYRHGHSRRIQLGLVVYGLDESTDGDPTRPDPFLQAIAARTGIALVAVRTNVRVLDPSVRFWWDHAQTATWAGVAHGLWPAPTDVVIGSDDPITHPPLHGSDPVLDDAFSSTNLRIHHGALRLTRHERVAIVAACDALLPHLQVCNQPRWRWRTLNCGRCEKCTRTMLALEALGALDRATGFPPGGVSAQHVRGIVLPDPTLRTVYAELLPALAAAGRADLVAAVRALLRRSRLRSSVAATRRLHHRAAARGAHQIAAAGRPAPRDHTTLRHDRTPRSDRWNQ